MRQISADHHTKEDGPKDDFFILQDNLDDQVQQNINICVRRDTTPYVGITILSTNITWILLNQVQEIRSGFWFGVYLDEQLWDYGNVEQWYLGLLPASHEQILINFLLTKAWIQVFSPTNYLDTYFITVGCGRSATG